METRLQSNEVRIPKAEFDLTATALPCRYFKSSFARSLSVGAASLQLLQHADEKSFIRSMFSDYAVPPLNYPMANATRSLTFEFPVKLANTNNEHNHHNDDVDVDVVYRNGDYHKHNNHHNVNDDNDDDDDPDDDGDGGDLTPVCQKHVWTTCQQTTMAVTGTQQRNADAVANAAGGGGGGVAVVAGDSAESEVLRLRQECQSLIEENRRLFNAAAGQAQTATHTNVEVVLLQNQVDTLQWQLKQVESSRQMYRAVMEEVVRFLDRCHRSLDAMQTVPMPRSKSVHQVSSVGAAQSTPSSSAPVAARARSSISLIDTVFGQHFGGSRPDVAAMAAMTAHDLQSYEIGGGGAHNVVTSSTATMAAAAAGAANSNAFRTSTWRRSPKRLNAKQQHLLMSTIEVDVDKLAQEAFRLARTAQNLLLTQEPVLASRRPNSVPSAFTQRHHGQSPRQNSRCSSSSSYTKDEFYCGNVSPTPPPPPLSLHARCTPINRNKTLTNSRAMVAPTKHCGNIGATIVSSTEDESGFSSMSSFQENGLPLVNSAAISGTSTPRSFVSSLSSSSSSSSSSRSSSSSTGGGVGGGGGGVDEFHSLVGVLNSTNSTLTATKEVCHTASPIAFNHRRWDSAPIEPLKRLSTATAATVVGDEKLKVLWV